MEPSQEGKISFIKHSSKMKEKPKIQPFDTIEPYTRTVVVITNWTLNIKRIFDNLPIVDYVVIPKKRGRKSSVLPPDPNQDIPPGSIVSAKYDEQIKGALIKKKKKGKSDANCMKNSLSMYIKLEEKLINLKIYDNGKFQLTGCKKVSHAEKSVMYMFSIIRRISQLHDDIYDIRPTPTGELYPVAVFKIVMINIKYSIGFEIDREQLDQLMNSNGSEFISHYEPVVGYSGVNIKYSSTNPHEDMLTTIKWKGGRIVKTKVSYANYYLGLLSEKDRKKQLRKKHEHTHMAFQSGEVLQSGPRYDEMKESYYKFVNFIHDNKKLVEESLRRKDEKSKFMKDNPQTNPNLWKSKAPVHYSNFITLQKYCENSKIEDSFTIDT